VHRAGRAGRIGSTAGGDVCTVVTVQELAELQGMVDELGLQLEVVRLEQQQGLGLLGSELAGGAGGAAGGGRAGRGGG